jgi:hypothetical protein
MKTVLRCFALLLIAAALTACQSYLLPEAVSRSGDRLFWDDFSDASGGWQTLSDANGSLEYADGAYRISVQQPSYELGAVSGHAYRDVRVEVDAVRLAGPVQNLFGLICRATNHSNYYFFAISSDGYYAVGKLQNGSASLLGQKMMTFSIAIATAAQPNHLRFDCVGQTLTAYVNGQALTQVQDGEFADGDAGLIVGTFDTGGVQISFDNFAVIKP